MRWLDWYGDGSVWVVDLALACCALEVEAAALGAAAAGSGAPADPPSFAAGADVIAVVSGTVTDQLAPAVLGLLDGIARQTGRRPSVISFGACASSGGPYWDSYAVTKGVDQLVPVDAYVPGCPPSPEAMTEVVARLTRRSPVWEPAR